MAEVQLQHRQLPLATIHENMQQSCQSPQSPQSSRSSPTSQKSSLNPACQTFTPQPILMESLDPFYVLPADAKAIFSTHDGQYEKRSLQIPLPVRVARSDVAKDVEAKFNTLWDQHRVKLHDLKPLRKQEQLYQFFDAVDLYTEGVEFCCRVVAKLSEHSQELASQTHIDIDGLAKSWVQDEGSKLLNTRPDEDVTLHHPDFSPENVAYWEHEQDLALLRRAINHYMALYRLDCRASAERLISLQLQEQYPNRPIHQMHPQAQCQHAGVHATRQQPPYHSQQDLRQGALIQYSNENRSFGNSEQPNTSALRDRGWSIGSRGRGSRRNYSNQQHSRHGNRMSPPREQPSYQRNLSDNLSGPSPPILGPNPSYQTHLWRQSLNQQLESRAYGLADDEFGEQFVVFYNSSGNPTLIYDGETKEGNSFNQPALTVFVANFHDIPGYLENHELKRLLSACGQVVAVSYLATTPNPIAFVEFKHPLSAEQAITRFNNHLLPHNTLLTVKAKRDGRSSRSGSGTSNASFAMHRRNSIQEQQSYPSFSAQTWPNTLLPRPVLTDRLSSTEQIEHVPLRRIENLPSMLYSQQDARVDIPVEKEHSPIKENNVKKKNNNKKKTSGNPTPTTTPLRSRSVVRSENMQENQRPQSKTSAVRGNSNQSKGLRVDTEDKNKENTRPSDPMNSGPPITGQSKPKKSKNKKKMIAKSDGGHPESYVASFNKAPSESSDAFSPLDSFSPEKPFTPNTSFSTNSSKAPSFALSDRGRVPGNLKAGAVANKDGSPLERSVLPEIVPERGTTEIDGNNFHGKVAIGTNDVRGHSKKTSSSSAPGGNSVRKADGHKREGSIFESMKHGEQKIGGENAGGEYVSGRKFCEPSVSKASALTPSTETTRPKDVKSTERVPQAPLAQAKKAEQLELDFKKAACAPELIKLPSTPVDEGKAISTASDTPPVLSTEKKKARAKVVIPLNFGRPQPFHANDLRTSIELDSLGSSAWPFVKSSRPI